MVTETLFKSTLSQMASRIATLEQGCVKPDLLDFCELCKKYQEQLQHCRTVKIGKIEKTHSALVKCKETNKGIINKHVTNLAVVLEALWLRRNAETSRFFGHTLVKIPLNYHQVIKCTFPKWFYSVVNNPIKVICNKIGTKFAKAHEMWKSGKYKIQESKLEAIRWLIKAH